jgi:hypothetical protein
VTSSVDQKEHGWIISLSSPNSSFKVSLHLFYGLGHLKGRKQAWCRNIVIEDLIVQLTKDLASILSGHLW